MQPGEGYLPEAHGPCMLGGRQLRQRQDLGLLGCALAACSGLVRGNMAESGEKPRQKGGRTPPGRPATFEKERWLQCNDRAWTAD